MTRTSKCIKCDNFKYISFNETVLNIAVLNKALSLSIKSWNSPEEFEEEEVSKQVLKGTFFFSPLVISSAILPLHLHPPPPLDIFFPLFQGNVGWNVKFLLLLDMFQIQKLLRTTDYSEQREISILHNLQWFVYYNRIYVYLYINVSENQRSLW